MLALQGGFAAHQRMLQGLGACTREVRVPADLDGLDGLVVPGGESTTMTLGIEREGLAEPLRELAAAGIPILGSCAGLIMLDRDHLGVMDMRAERNAFGRQIQQLRGGRRCAGDRRRSDARRLHPRPVDRRAGPGVEILGSVDGQAVAARQGKQLAVSFHAELGGDDRLHRLFLGLVGEASTDGRLSVA